jgi:predicted DNA-binding transcriptional regulator YafY
MAPIRADWREVTMPLESIEQGVRQLLSFGAEVEVLEPLEMRAELLRLARQVVALYHGG